MMQRCGIFCTIIYINYYSIAESEVISMKRKRIAIIIAAFIVLGGVSIISIPEFTIICVE